MRVAIIGAGAAGCFCAVNLKRLLPKAEVHIFESGNRPLAKVAITGGGRCNLTNSFNGISSLGQAYPRGERLMKRLMYQFSHTDTFDWWTKEGVNLVTQPDECVFPKSQDAMQIVTTLTSLMTQLRVKVSLGHRVVSVSHDSDYLLSFADCNNCPEEHADVVVVTTGGSPKLSGLNFLQPLNLKFENPVPSLFTLCIANKALTTLMGTVVEHVSVSMSGTKFKSVGPLLITHWGMSGPSILKLSSYAARHLAEQDYKAHILVNWMGEASQEEVASVLRKISDDNPSKLVSNCYPSVLNSRFWQYLLNKMGLPEDTRWQTLGKKNFNRLVALLSSDDYEVNGKGQFKEEFVTCGGVALSNLDANTLECKTHQNLYFAGEVTDVDAITGGFNLQAAWTMGYVVAKSIANKHC